MAVWVECWGADELEPSGLLILAEEPMVSAQESWRKVERAVTDRLPNVGIGQHLGPM